MPTAIETNLKKQVSSALNRQGFSVAKTGHFALKSSDREAFRHAHDLAKAERLNLRIDFIEKFTPIAASMIPDGKEIDVNRIDPVLVEVKPDSVEENYFRWWNLVWWSLPYERAYGRQMRFLVVDAYHNAVIGLIGLQSPILSWNVRDEYLGIEPEKRDFWVNQSLSAQRLGALPPYNALLGGKLVALLMTSDQVRNRFRSKYFNVRTVMSDRILPARLLFITTTGAYGKSSVYQRLKFNGDKVSEFIGYSQGSGSFHISNTLFEDLMKYLDKSGIETDRGYGSGPSRKLRLIDNALQMLGFKNGAAHGIKRAVYLFPLVRNLKEVIQNDRRPLWHNRSIADLTDFWKTRWAIPRTSRDDSYRKFEMHEFLNSIESNLLETCSLFRKK